AAPEITIESCDTNDFEAVRDVRRMEYNNVLDLFKAAIRRTGVQRGVRIIVRSEAPPGSGLGSSAALGAATMAALSRFLQWNLLPYEVAREAQALEVEELGLECGVQDQIAAAYGGVNYMNVQYPEARNFPVALDTATPCALDDRLVRVHTGLPHFSSAMQHQPVPARRRGAARGCRGRRRDRLQAERRGRRRHRHAAVPPQPRPPGPPRRGGAGHAGPPSQDRLHRPAHLGGGWVAPEQKRKRLRR